MRRTIALTLAAAVFVTHLAGVCAQSDLDVWTNMSYYDEWERFQGNGYTIEVTVTNHYGIPIEVTFVGISMDWQDPGDFHHDFSMVYLEDGMTHTTPIFIDIPSDEYVGDHMYHVEIQYNVLDGENTYQEMWSGDWNDFYVESSDGDGGSGDGEDEGGMFGGGEISIDWDSIDNSIPTGALLLLFTFLIIGVFVILPAVYFYLRR